MNKLVIKCGMLIDCVDEELKANKFVYIDDGIISRITDFLEEGYEVVDYSDYTVLPGLINCHTHICLQPVANTDDILKYTIPEQTIIAAENAKKYLYSGVTTIRDMGGISGIDLAVRNAINADMIEGPQIMASGQLLTMTGGHGHTIGMECDGIDECLKGARTQLKRGADIIKFMATGGVLTKGVEPGSAQLSEEEMSVMVKEAHKKNKKTASHAQGNEGIQNAIRAGVDSIEHGFYMSEETADMMKDNDVYYIPTFSPPHFILKNGIEAGIPYEFVRKTEESEYAHQKSFLMCKERGVKIAAGTDGGTPFNLHENTYFETKLLKESGMTAYEAILATTLVAAKCLALEDRGMISEGKRADIIAVKGNPLEHIDCLKDVAGIIKNGKVIK
ncbi:MAG: amidohydrolase family protein [Clostridia bacterium]|nr:amidohydrolase family protein [Clostridia bacterium]